MSRALLPVNKPDDILVAVRDTPIGRLLCYHNLGAEMQPYPSAELLIGMCMDNRKSLRIPDNFAFILRTGGANMRLSEFKVSFAIAIGGVDAIALVGHTNCGMVDLASRREAFVEGLVAKVGWDRAAAESHFDESAPLFEIGDETGFTFQEALRLRERYPNVLIAPLIYRIEDGLLYQVEDPTLA